MLGLRDLGWALVVCAALSGYFQWRPAWNAREQLERDAHEAFLAAYQGRREIDGDIVAPAGKGTHIDPKASPITRRSFQILADKISWTGGRAELVARHSVELLASEEDMVEVHVTLEKRGSRWVYTLFEVRDGVIQTEFDGTNPWIAALQAAQAAREAAADDS